MKQRKRFILLAFIILLVGASSYLFSFYRIFGNDMAPNIQQGSYVVSYYTQSIKTGDVIAYQRDNKIYVKRVLGLPGQKVDMDQSGNLFVDDQFVSEPYIKKLSLHPLSVSLPLEVTDGSYFVLGDNRAEAMDSRLDLVGLVKKEEILGKVVFNVFPFESFGLIRRK